MKELFNITGLFYERFGHKCRKYLDIKHKNSEVALPDLMVIMMNPGGSKPINNIDNYNDEIDTIPDKTQDQIMKVMLNASFNYARVLNLSDLRTPKSEEFYDFILSRKSKLFPHSIFDPARQKELKKLFVADVPVIFAWGVNPKLQSLAQMVINTIGYKLSVGKKKYGSQVLYYHPLPRNDEQRQQWVNEISKSLNERIQRKGFRYFFAEKSHNTWPKLFVLTEDGVLYCEYLDRYKLTIFKEKVDFSYFEPSEFKWSGYQSIVEIKESTAINVQLTKQSNWILRYIKK